MQIAHVWYRLRHSFWFVPSLITLAAAVLSQITLAMDEATNWSNYNGLRWIDVGSGESAGTLLSAIVGSMITATSVTFSMTLVALSLTTSQYGPRLLHNFMGRPGSQIVLGTFLATFIYGLLILRSVRIASNASVVPHLSVTVAIGLALTSVGVLIFFIHHIAKSIQADTIIGQVYQHLIASIDRMFPGLTEEEPCLSQSLARMQRAPDDTVLSLFKHEGIPVASSTTGYLQTIDTNGLLKFAEEHSLVVILHRRPGHFLVQGQHIATLYLSHSSTKELLQDVCAQLIVGQERTSEQDLEFAILNLVEIAVRALSPGINDPYTAIRCIDWLGAALCRIAQRDFPDPHQYDKNGTLRIIRDPESFEGFVDAAFDQIRHASAGNPALYNRLIESLTMLALLAKPSVSYGALQHHADMVLRDAQRTIKEAHDYSAFERRYHVFSKTIERRKASPLPKN